HGLRPILCIGETWDQRARNQTESVLAPQLTEALTGVDKDHGTEVVIAYEPVWAIGSGQPATPAQAREAHRHIRARLTALWGHADRRDGDDLHAHLAVAGDHVQTAELLLDHRLGQTACVSSGGAFAGFGFPGASSILSYTSARCAGRSRSGQSAFLASPGQSITTVSTSLCGLLCTHAAARIPALSGPWKNREEFRCPSLRSARTAGSRLTRRRRITSSRTKIQRRMNRSGNTSTWTVTARTCRTDQPSSRRRRYKDGSQEACFASPPSTLSKKADCKSRVTGPGLPVPTVPSSRSRIGVSSAAVPVMNTSSAM